MTNGNDELAEFAYDAYYTQLLSTTGGEFPPFAVLSSHQMNSWRMAASAVVNELNRRRKEG